MTTTGTNDLLEQVSQPSDMDCPRAEPYSGRCLENLVENVASDPGMPLALIATVASVEPGMNLGGAS